ncbi:hypothetical protein GQR58_021776 [Nymphon striatum]|nr:hypothetical protein GQR58_021776 [Nymphon striatum]
MGRECMRGHRWTKLAMGQVEIIAIEDQDREVVQAVIVNLNTIDQESVIMIDINDLEVVTRGDREAEKGLGDQGLENTKSEKLFLLQLLNTFINSLQCMLNSKLYYFINP